MTVAECVWMGARNAVGSMEVGHRTGIQNAAHDSLRQQLVALEAQLPSRFSKRYDLFWPSAMSCSLREENKLLFDSQCNVDAAHRCAL